MSIKPSLTAAAVSILLAGHAGAAVVITGWNTGNVAVSTVAPATAGESVIYDRVLPNGSARSNGKIVFDGSESDTPGLKVVTDAPVGVPASSGDVSNCVMANSTTTCNGPQQSGKRFKFQRTAHEATDMVFDVDPSGEFTNPANDGTYKFFQAFGNDTGARLGSFTVSLGSGLGAGFVGSTDADGLSFKQTFDGKPPNNSQFSAYFSNGLFGPKDDIHTMLGYFDDERAGFGMTFNGEDSFASTGLFGTYRSLFGEMLSYDELPLGYFYDDDGDAATDDVLVAHQYDGKWIRNRAIDLAGDVLTEFFGHGGEEYASEGDLVADLAAMSGLSECGSVAAGTACLAGSDFIDDLAKFNLTFFVDPSGYRGDQFTLRFDSTVPEPSSIALALLALGGVGASARRRKA